MVVICKACTELTVATDVGAAALGKRVGGGDGVRATCRYWTVL